MTKLHHVGLSVRDLDRMSAWYREAFGFEVVFPFEIPTMRGAMMSAPSGVRVELLERKGSGGGIGGLQPDEALLTLGWGHIALDVIDLDGEYARLLESGAGPVWDPRQSPEPGVRMAFVHDAEGNLIELLERTN
jgi:catechol 2,3-dioxygenase-like lactoylglutathione lyase family enzyme